MYKQYLQYLLLLIATIVITSCSEPSSNNNLSMTGIKPLPYPETQKQEISDTFFGTTVTDPYRWLELDTATNTKHWVAAQNNVTFDYLKKIPFRDAIQSRYEELFNYPKLGSPIKAGEYYFFYKNDGLQNQPVIYKQKGLDGAPEVFLDPNAANPDGTTTMGLSGISKDDKYAAYSVSEGGSDWQKIYIIDIASNQQLDDVINWVKFGGASWYKDGFFYSRYPAVNEGDELSSNNKNHSVYYHKLGADQSEDQLIFADQDNPDHYHFSFVSDDEQYQFLYKQPGTDGYATYFKKLGLNEDFKPLFEGYKNKNSVVKHLGNGQVLLRTNYQTPNYKLVQVDLNDPSPKNWKTIIPESKNLLQGVSSGGGKLFASYLEKATTRIYQYEYKGNNKKLIELPGLGSAGGFSGKDDFTSLFYVFSSFTYPNTIFQYDIQSGKSTEFFQSELKFNPKDYIEKQVTYTSKDGTPVTMFIVHKKDIELDGNNPAYLYGYGGFNLPLTPSFSTSRIILLENGGIFAMPNLRGGGEYGEEWHKEGMLLNKQNVFDDFIYAGKYLVENGYTKNEKLGIAGGSNGGLLVGATMTQEPSLAAVAMPSVGVMDMLRYHLFTVGKGWIPEYGSSEESEESFKNLIAYSPLHNLKKDTNYPATLIFTGDHDDRVVPAHSFKFAASLQESNNGDNPTLIRIATNAGHGAGKPIAKILEEEADRWAFLFYNTNSPVIYNQK